MSTQLIELEDGLLVEVETPTNQSPQPIAAGAAQLVSGSLNSVRGLLIRMVEPVASAWEELNREVEVEQVEVSLSLAFEVGGSVYVAKGNSKANVNYKLTVRAKRADEQADG